MRNHAGGHASGFEAVYVGRGGQDEGCLQFKMFRITVFARAIVCGFLGRRPTLYENHPADTPIPATSQISQWAGSKRREPAGRMLLFLDHRARQSKPVGQMQVRQDEDSYAEPIQQQIHSDDMVAVEVRKTQQVDLVMPRHLVRKIID